MTYTMLKQDKLIVKSTAFQTDSMHATVSWRPHVPGTQICDSSRGYHWCSACK
jgi:hypothetical protein